MFLRAWLTVVLAAALLLGYEWLHSRVKWLQSWQTSHFFTPYDTNAPIENNGLIADSLEQTLAEIQSLTDSADTLAVVPDSARFPTIAAAVRDTDIYTGYETLAPFFQALTDLKQGKRKRVRIAYWGDSTTEGDITVSGLRDTLQKLLGGCGVGFVNIKANGASFRKTILHSFDDRWTVKSYFRSDTDVRFPLGIAGNYFTASDALLGTPLSATFSASKEWKTVDTFYQIYAFYGNAPDSMQRPVTMRVTVDNQTTTHTLSDKKLLNILTLQQDTSLQMRIECVFPRQFPLYGLSFESESGIFVDNLAKRSDSGGNLMKIKGNMLEAFNEFMQYDLVILHYGANVLRSRHTNYSSYDKILTANIQHLKQYLRNVPVLVVGNADKASRLEGVLQTDPAVHGLIRAQRHAAIVTNSAFFDLFRAMGGNGSMVEWVNKQPPLASKDYVHFNPAGGKVVAKLLWKYFDTGWQQYNQQRSPIDQMWQ